MRRIAAIACASMLGISAGATSITEDFESFQLGTLHGQAGAGGISWAATSPFGVADAYAVLPGFESVTSGRWEAEDVGDVSQGDDMLAHFASIGPRITVQAMTYAYLGVDAQYDGRRSASFNVLSDLTDAVGVGLVWHVSGRLADTEGNLSNVQFLNGAWAPIRIDLDYSTGNYAVSYGGASVVNGTFLVRDATAATLLNINLGTVSLENEPNANDALLIDNIVITPEPAAALTALIALALRRRR